MPLQATTTAAFLALLLLLRLQALYALEG